MAQPEIVVLLRTNSAPPARNSTESLRFRSRSPSSRAECKTDKRVPIDRRTVGRTDVRIDRSPYPAPSTRVSCRRSWKRRSWSSLVIRLEFFRRWSPILVAVAAAAAAAAWIYESEAYITHGSSVTLHTYFESSILDPSLNRRIVWK